jgi:hypothetical protein
VNDWYSDTLCASGVRLDGQVIGFTLAGVPLERAMTAAAAQVVLPG